MSVGLDKAKAYLIYGNFPHDKHHDVWIGGHSTRFAFASCIETDHDPPEGVKRQCATFTMGLHEREDSAIAHIERLRFKKRGWQEVAGSRFQQPIRAIKGTVVRVTEGRDVQGEIVWSEDWSRRTVGA